MCDPVSATMAATEAISITGSVLKHKAEAAQKKATDAAANTERDLNIRDLSIRQQEERFAAALDTSAGARQATQAAAVSQVGAAEAGVTGSSLSMLLNNIKRDQAVQAQGVSDNSVVTLAQLDRMKIGAAATAESRKAAVLAPSKVATGLEVAGALTDFATARINRKRP